MQLLLRTKTNQEYTLFTSINNYQNRTIPRKKQVWEFQQTLSKGVLKTRGKGTEDKTTICLANTLLSQASENVAQLALLKIQCKLLALPLTHTRYWPLPTLLIQSIYSHYKLCIKMSLPLNMAYLLQSLLHHFGICAYTFKSQVTTVQQVIVASSIFLQYC